MAIEEGDHVVLETSPPPLDGVLVNGTLEFADDSIVSNDGGDSETGGPDQEGAAIHDATDGGEYEKLVPTTSDVE